MLAILDLLSTSRPAITAQEIQEELGYSRASTYRYLRTFETAGLLASTSGGRYALGARVIELDRQIRMTDPLYVAGVGPMRELAERDRVNAFLTSYYRETVICIDQVTVLDDVPHSWDRGRPMPMFRGAASKVILANLTTTNLQRIALERSIELAEAGLGENWAQFQAFVAGVRKDGYAVSYGEVDPGVTSAAAPVIDLGSKVTGSLVIVLAADEYAVRDEPALLASLVEAAADISRRLQRRDQVNGADKRAS